MYTGLPTIKKKTGKKRKKERKEKYEKKTHAGKTRPHAKSGIHGVTSARPTL
jgi:hypothetical protein